MIESMTVSRFSIRCLLVSPLYCCCPGLGSRCKQMTNDYYRIRFYILAVSCTRGLSADQDCILWVWCSPNIHCFWERTNWSILHFVFILLWIYIKWITVRTLFEEEYSWMCHWLRIFYVSWELLLGYKAKKIVGKFWL